MSLIQAFKFRTVGTVSGEIPSVWSLGCRYDFFVKHDILTIYAKILTDVIQRTQGIDDKTMTSLFDNCLVSESNKGLITLLAEAMECKADLYIVYKVGVLRRADKAEEETIKADYQRQGSSTVGTFVSFRNYVRTDMLKIYSSMEYSTLNSLNKKLNLGAALQFKMSKMRESVSAQDSTGVITQAKTVATALGNGNDVLLDAEDEILSAVPEMDTTKEAITFLDAKRSFYLGMPISYITGEQTAGIGSTGEADTKAVERGLRQYYISIIKPVLETVFGIKVSFKSQDFRQIGSALEAVKTFELIGNDMLSAEEKKLIVMKLFDIEEPSK